MHFNIISIGFFLVMLYGIHEFLFAKNEEEDRTYKRLQNYRLYLLLFL